MRNRIRVVAALTLLASIASSFAGSVVWRHTFDGGAPDEGMGVKTDAEGNSYVAWMTYLAPRAWIMVSKLNVNGEEQWTVSLPVATAGPPRSGSCRIVVAGEVAYLVCHEDSADRSAFVSRLAADGSVTWTTSITDISWPQAFESDGAAAYLTGTNTAGQLALQKFDDTGAAWTLPITNGVSLGRPMSANQLVLTSNDVLVTGWQESDQLDYGTRHVTTAFALRCSMGGTLQWLRSVNSTNRLNTIGNGIAKTADETVIVVGQQSQNSTNGLNEFADNLFVRFDADGNELLRTTLPRAGILNQVVPLASGDVLTIGSDLYPGALRIARTSTDGTIQWLRVRRFPGGLIGAGAFRVLEGERLLIGGYDEGANGNNTLRNLFLLEVSADTGKARHKSLAVPRGASRHFSQRRDFELDSQGNFYFLTGDGTPWPNVIAVKYRGLDQ